MIEFRHVGITVTDIERSLEFYRELLGFEVYKDMEESGEYIDNFSGIKDIKVRTVKMKATDGSLIELLEYKSHRNDNTKCKNELITTIGCSHFALTTDDLDYLYKKLSHRGIRFNSEPQLSPDGYAKIAFCRDPDGVLIELVEVL